MGLIAPPALPTGLAYCPLLTETRAHLHLRDENEMPTADLGIAQRTMDLIAERCPIHIQLSTGVGLSVPFEDREIRQLVRVRSVSAPEALLLSPGEAFFARENLKLRLLSARLALLQRDEPAFRADMLLTLRNSSDKLTTLLARLSRYGSGNVERQDASGEAFDVGNVRGGAHR